MRTSLFAAAPRGVLAMVPLAMLLAVTSMGCQPEYPNCDTDEDCHEGEFCVNGRCQQCRTDEDCAAGERCAEGACEAIPGYCESNGDCPTGQECKNNRCTEVTQQQTDLDKPEDTEPDTSCSLQPVYFGFDSSTISSSARNTLQSNADCIEQKDMGSVHLTGHADPRGTEEYNLALGERRARSVKEYMQQLGVSKDKLSISSMGEEMASGTDEESWAKDRKVEFSQR
jgi:peptidoglycan-associated lipoprotein